MPLKVTALPADILKVVAAVEAAARTSVALFRLIAARPSGPLARLPVSLCPTATRPPAFTRKLVPAVNEPLVSLSVKKPPPVLVMVSTVPPSLTRPARLMFRPRQH